MTSFDVTRRELSFGAYDTVTGWPSKTYTETTIRMHKDHRGVPSPLTHALGAYSKHPFTAYIPDVIHEGDQIKSAFNDIFEVNSAVPVEYGNQFDRYECELIFKPFADRPATSGTWHLDSDSVRTDPRFLHKNWFDAYDAAIYKDNGASAASTHIAFDGADIPIKYWFLATLGLSLDLLYTVGKEAATPLLDYQHKTYAFNETVPITCWAVNKSGITGTNLVEQAEQEIRHVVTDHPIGSVRSIQSTKHLPVDLGGGNFLYSTTVTIRYVRANDEYVPTLPTLTWGTATGTFIFPNVINKIERYVNNDIFSDIPGRLGSFPQSLGSKSLEVELTVDLDMEHSNLTWKRPQTTSPKSDASNIQVFQNIIHEGADTEAYQTLTLEWGDFPVRLTDMQRGQDGNQNHLTLTFKEYNATAANTLYTTRWGI